MYGGTGGAHNENMGGRLCCESVVPSLAMGGLWGGSVAEFFFFFFFLLTPKVKRNKIVTFKCHTKYCTGNGQQ